MRRRATPCLLLFFLLFSASTAALDGLTANELGFLQGLSARDIRELGELCGIRDAALLQYHDLAARLSSPNEHTPLLREALSELGHSVLPHEQTSRAAVDSTVGGGIPPFETPADCRRTFQHLQTFAYYGPCVQAWDPHANFSTGSGVAIPPPPNSSKTAHRFRCKPTAQDERKAECGFSGSESDWTYDPLREGQHQLTFYPYVSAQKFSFSGQGLERAELGRTEMFSASVVTAACPAHWVLKGRLVGPSIVPIRCVRADSQTWNCSYAVSEAGEYRVEIVLHPHGNVAFFHGSPIRGPSQHCHKRATIRPRAHEQCEKGDAWAAAPLFAAEYILNRTGLLASSASSSSASASESPSAFRQTPLCARGNHAGRWLRLRSVAHVTVLNGSAFSGSNLDFVLDSVGLNRGWIWAPYECHYHFYTPAEFQACMSDEHRRITVDVEGDSLNREVLDSLAQLLDVTVVTNGQLIKPHKSFSYGETLHWAAYDSVRGSVAGAFLVGPSAVVAPYQAGTLAGFAQRIAERVTEVIADCQWEGRVCVYVLPPALHSHIHAHWRAFAAELEQRLRDDGVWDHVVDARAMTESRWDASHDGIHYLWAVAHLGPVYDELLAQREGEEFAYESRRGRTEEKQCCQGASADERRHKAVEFIAEQRAAQSECAMWNGGVGRMPAMVAANLLCNAWLHKRRAPTHPATAR